jgi:hypothetical protein
MSPGHFSRSFRATYGETPRMYLMTRRIATTVASKSCAPIKAADSNE